MRIYYLFIVCMMLLATACKQKQLKAEEPAKVIQLSPLMEFYLQLSGLNSTNVAVRFDTLYRFADTSYLVNIDDREGCQGPGYCNVLVVTEGKNVIPKNHIKGYIDSVVKAPDNLYLYAKVIDAEYKTTYRLALRERFMFDSLLEQRLISNNIQLKVNPLTIDTMWVNEQIGW